MPSFGYGEVFATAEEPLRVGLVLAEQRLRGARPGDGERPQIGVLCRDLTVRRRQGGLRGARRPRPGVAEPQCGQQVQRRLLRTGVAGPDPHQQVVRAGLGVVDADLPVPVVVEDAGVDELVLRVVTSARRVRGREVVVGELGLRVVVTPAHPRVGGRAVEVPPVVLDVFTVVALGSGQAEGTLLENRVAAVPQRQPQAQPLPVVAHAGQPVLVPPVRAGAGMPCGQARRPMTQPLASGLADLVGEGVQDDPALEGADDGCVGSARVVAG